MQGSVVASLIVRVLGDSKDAERALDRVSSKVDSTAARMKKVGTAMIGIGAIGVGALFGVVNAAADFEQAMANVNAVTNLTAAQFEDVSNLARQLGRDTVFSATEAAGAIEELAKAGVGIEDIMNGAAKGATALAAAAGVEVPQAAIIMANAMNIFKLSGDQATHVADVFAAAANKSAADVGELALGMSQSANVAAQFGISLEETVGTLALFSDYGLRGSDAGTSFKTMLMSMLDPTAKQSKLMNELGISFFDANGQFIGLDNTAALLRDRLSGLSEEQRNTALAVLFGSDAVRAANIMYQAGADGVNEYTAAVNDEGAAARMAEARTKTMQGAIERLKGAVTDLAIGVGEVLTPYVVQFAGWAEKTVEMFGGLPREFKVAAAIALVLVAALIPLGAALIAISTVLPAIAAGFVLLTGPVGGIIVALAILGIAYKKNILGFGDAIDGIVKALRPVGRWIRLFVEGIRKLGKDTERVHKILNALPAPLSKLLLIFARVKQGVDRFIRAWKEAGALAAFKTIPRSIEILGRTIGNFFQSIGLERFGQQFKAVFDEVGQAIGSVVALVDDVIHGRWSEVWGDLVDIAKNAFDLWLAGLKANLALILDLLSPLPYVDQAIAIGTGIIDGILEGLESRLDGLLGWIRGAVGVFIGVFKTILGIASPSTVFRDIGLDIIAGLLLGLTQGIGRVLSWFRGLAGRILGAIVGAGEWLVETGVSILSGLYDGILDRWGVIREFFERLPGRVRRFIGDVGDELAGIGRALIRGLRDGILEIWNTVVKPWFGTIALKVIDAMPAIGVLLGTLTRTGKAIVGGLWAGVQTAWKPVSDFFTNIATTIADLIPDNLEELVKAALQGLWNALDWIGGKIGTVLGLLADLAGKIPGLGGGGSETGGQPATGDGTTLPSTGQAMTVAFDPGTSLADIEAWASSVAAALAPLNAYLIFISGEGAGTTNMSIQAPPFKGDGTLQAVKRWAKDVWKAFVGMNLDVLIQMRGMKTNVDTQFGAIKTSATARATQTRAAVTNEWIGARNDAATVFTGMRNGVANAFVGMRNDANQIAGDMRDKVVDKFKAMAARAGGNGEGETNFLKSSVRTAFNTMRDEAADRAFQLRNRVVNEFIGMRNDAVSVTNGLASRISNAIYAARDAANNAASSFYYVGQNIAVGIRNGISDTAYIIANAAASAVNGAIDAANQAAGNASPSKRGVWTGSMIAAGMALGIERGMGDVARAGHRLAGAAFGSASGSWSVGGSGVAPVAAVAGGSGGTTTIVMHNTFHSNATDNEEVGKSFASQIVREFNVKGKPKGFR